MTTDLVTYLSFDGQCEAAFKHYEKVLGGKILMMMRHADAPASAGVPQTPEMANRIMHARLKVGDRLLMGGDAPPQFVSKPQGFCVSIMVDDPAEAQHIFRELGEGGVVRGNPFEAYLPPLSSTLPLLEMLNIRFGCGVNYHFCPPGTERDPSHPFMPCRTTTPAK